jgi:predicted DNA-binding transcriptional regulator AlpA
MEKQLYNLKQLTEILSFSRSTIYGMMKAGDFPRPQKFGSMNRWFKSDIEAWLKSHKVGQNDFI